MLSVAAPAWLWLLVPVWASLWWVRRRVRVSALLVRGAILSLVVSALAGLGWRWDRADPGVVFIVDNSGTLPEDLLVGAADWISGAVEGRARDAWRIVATTPYVRRLDSHQDLVGGVPGAASPASASKRLAEALRVAVSEAPDGRPNRIVVVGDGLSLDGADALAAAALSLGAGVPVDAVGIEVAREPEVELAGIELPPRLGAGERFAVRVRIRSTGPAEAKADVFFGDVLEATAELALAAGEEVFELATLDAQPGISRVDVRLSAAPDTVGWNNSASASVAGGDAARVLLLDREPALAGAAVRWLEAAGFSVEVRPPWAAPASAGALQDFGLVVLSDADAAELPPEAGGALARWVSEFGGGLLVCGGEEAFAAGGYFGTALAEVLPVRVEFQDAADLPVSALLVVLDRSGSMAAMIGGVTKMSLANQGAARALELLAAKDLFGVYAVDTQVHPVIPLERVQDRAEAERRILAIQSMGGGIYVYTAMAAAFRALDPADARIKHVILFSDSADAEEQVAGGAGGGASSLDLATAMLSRGISTSVVALGAETDKDTEFLRLLAARGGGRFYLTSDATTLPRIFAEETLRATRSNLVEEPSRAVPFGAADATDGIAWDEAPFLLGYNATLPRDGADLLLVTESGEPLYAAWRYGLGRVGAFTSDIKGRWTADWMGWPGFGRWIEQAARSLARREGPPGLFARAEREGDRETVYVEALDESGKFRDGLALAVSRASGSPGSPESRIARQIAPGLYAAEFESPDGPPGLGAYAVSDGSGEAPLILPVPSASGGGILRDPGPGLARFASAGGGMVNPDAAEVFRPTGRSVEERRDFAPVLLALALLLVPVEVWLRSR